MKTKFILIGAMVAALAAPVVNAADAQPMSPAQQKQIEDVVRNYLVKNPEVIMESVQALQQKQMDQARKVMQKTQEKSPKYVDALFHQTDDPIGGNANGKVTVVDFFDYQCPHCIHMTPVIEGLLKSNSDVRIVFKEFPIRGPLSEFAAKAGLAANKQGKYFEFHKAVMQQAALQALSEESILKAAQSVGLDVEKLKTDMKSDAISQKLKSTIKLAQDLQLMGTPAFFIAKTSISTNAKPADITFIPGQVDQDQLQTIIKKLS